MYNNPKCEFQYLTEHTQNNKFPAEQGVNRYRDSHLEAPGVDGTIIVKWMVTEWHDKWWTLAKMTIDLRAQ